MRSRETSFAPSLYRVSTDTLIAKHHLLAILIIVALQNLYVHYVMIPSPDDPHAPRVLHFSAFIYN